MSDTTRISRRDWFRLRPRRAEPSETPPADVPAAASHLMGVAPHGLQPLAQPINHDGMDLSLLPPMREAMLSEDDVRQLFADIELLATDVLLMQRSAHSPRATAAKATTAEQLHVAQDALLCGRISRLQIRYQWQTSSWIDTLERRDDRLRLIRIAHQLPNTPQQSSTTDAT